MSNLASAVETIIGRCLGVRAGESVLVIGDDGSRDLAAELTAAAARHGAEAVLALSAGPRLSGDEPPAPLAAALAAADAFLAPTSGWSLSHTHAREAATEAGVRGATLPGVTADMLARLMAVDFDALRSRSEAVAELLGRARSARLTCPRGTELTLDLTGRSAEPDFGDVSEPGAFSNLPAGEAYLSPLGGDGRVVATSLARIGRPDEPARLTVRDGRLVEAGDATGQQLLDELLAHGPQGANLAELGVGTNPAATVTGNVLEDEKALGTAHVAFGSSASIGGTVYVPIHRDVVVVDATLELDGRRVLDRGQLRPRW